jgi:RNA polymerase sigma-70 factor, ECF subfamily
LCAAMQHDYTQTTALLKALQGGDAGAAEKLLPLVYSELHRVANACMRRERPDHTLQPTALINEAYLRLIHEDIDWNGRSHFVGFAAHVMRQVLVDYARARNAQHRGGRWERIEFEEQLAVSPVRLEELTLVDAALNRLEKLHPRQARVVELRYFGGLSIEQIASLLGIAPRSVKRDWALARIWLFDELRPHADKKAGSSEKSSE